MTALVSCLVYLVLIPATLVLGNSMTGNSHYLIGTLIIIQMMIPFFLSFERKKPQARELVLIAVLCAIAIASRIVIPIPHFKPTFAVIMLAGVAFGSQTGFMVGAITAFASNFYLGQGPFTPWQMMAYGMGGLLAGLLARKGWLKNNRAELGFFAFFASVLVVGPLLDLCALFTGLATFSGKNLVTALGAGVLVNMAQGVCCFLMMLTLGQPLLIRLDRVKRKYGF